MQVNFTCKVKICIYGIAAKYILASSTQPTRLTSPTKVSQLSDHQVQTIAQVNTPSPPRAQHFPKIQSVDDKCTYMNYNEKACVRSIIINNTNKSYMNYNEKDCVRSIIIHNTNKTYTNYNEKDCVRSIIIHNTNTTYMNDNEKDCVRSIIIHNKTSHIKRELYLLD